MVLALLKSLGWLLAHTPELLLRLLAAGLGDAVFYGVRRRRRLVLSNLHHAFPEKPAAWHRRIGRESCRRMVETGMLSLASPFFSERRMREVVQGDPSLINYYASHRAAPCAKVMCSPHFANWEAVTAMPLLVPEPFPEFGIIFRPLDNPAADAWVKKTREKHGIKLLSRKEGFAEALKILRRGGISGVLFDQNAGMQGALTLLLDRVCSTTELPGLMAEKFGTGVYGIYPRRIGFWRIRISVQQVTAPGTPAAEITVGLNRWLEQLLRSDDDLCASWLWAHARWRNQDVPERRLRLEAKRDLLATDIKLRNLSTPPRRTRVWIRLPNWLGDVVMALPLLRAVRASRPDAEITLVAKRAFLPLLEQWAVADHLEPLPPRGFGYWRHFWSKRGEYPDVYLLFTNSFRGDFEAWLTGTPQRFGILRPGKRRPLLTRAFRVPADFDETQHHQLELWENFLRAFGLAVPPDLTPLPASAASSSAPRPIGLIPGSENSPEKRWPVAHWRALIEALPNERFAIFGTAGDGPIASAVAAGFASDRVENRAGRTDLPAFAAQLAGCRLLVTNDTGGMHLANALGVPLVALFGPTNPVRTGPVFAGPTHVLQPAGCARTGGSRLDDLKPEDVASQVRQALQRT